jgi:hypothetical protein
MAIEIVDLPSYKMGGFSKNMLNYQRVGFGSSFIHLTRCCGSLEMG